MAKMLGGEEYQLNECSAAVLKTTVYHSTNSCTLTGIPIFVERFTLTSTSTASPIPNTHNPLTLIFHIPRSSAAPDRRLHDHPPP